MDVRQLSADEFGKAVARGGSNETTPVAIGSDVIALCELLKIISPGLRATANRSERYVRLCNVGVLEKTKADGGTIKDLAGAFGNTRSLADCRVPCRVG